MKHLKQILIYASLNAIVFYQRHGFLNCLKMVAGLAFAGMWLVWLVNLCITELAR